jgi:hypothetical protein
MRYKHKTPRTDAAILSSNGQWSFELRRCSEDLERELAEMRERYQNSYLAELARANYCKRQRDRLAEAMNRIVKIYENPEKGCIPSSSDMYDEALQSLTTNDKDLARRTLDSE